MTYSGPAIRRAPRSRRGPRIYRVLLPIGSLAEAEVMLPVAEMLVRERHGQIVILHVVAAREGRPLSEVTSEVSRARESLHGLLSQLDHPAHRVRTIVREAGHVWDAIWEAVERERVSLLLLGWLGGALETTSVGDLTDPRLSAPPCDVIAVRPSAELAAPGGWQTVQRILLPVRGGPHSATALRVAYALARGENATVTLLHEAGNPLSETEAHRFDAFARALRSLKGFVRVVSARGDVANAIIERGGQHQVIVMGASTGPLAADHWGGPVLDAVAKGAAITLIAAKAGVALAGQVPEVEPHEYTPHDYPIAVVVDRWFAENTFRSDEFADLKRLVDLKRDQGLTVSVGLPALNEEETVGSVIETVREALMDHVPLLDELVLIDSGSTDRTRQIAAGLGIPVVVTTDILPKYGTYRGKGEALWKSLHVLEGDIVAWIDTDIRNIHPRFVYGVLGPLLRDARIQYVKGFYRRPLREGDKLLAGGGGRVTELTARPLLNLFFPELSGLIQPLSGEYAGRRQALERLPFFTGYGVETGLLVDVLENCGLSAIAQVDLQERIHRNQPLHSLSKMSFAIIQVAIRRLEERHKIHLLEDINETMNLIRHAPGYLYLEAVEIHEHERPPMITLPEYLDKRGLRAAGAQVVDPAPDGSSSHEVPRQ